MKEDSRAFTCLVFAVIAWLFGCVDDATGSPNASNLYFALALVLFAAFLGLAFQASRNSERE